MTSVDLESGKKPLRERSPFIDVPMINCADKVESNYYDHNDDEDCMIYISFYFTLNKQ